MKKVLSCSRRTDIPSCFLPELKSWFRQGFVDVKPSQFGDTVNHIDLTPDKIHSIVFWSKDYTDMFNDTNFIAYLKQNYICVFQYTLNGYSESDIQSLLEPGIKHDLKTRLLAAQKIVVKFGNESLIWRFDPIILLCKKEEMSLFYRTNLHDIDFISETLHVFGIDKVIVSFLDTSYAKVKRRASEHNILYCEETDKNKKNLLFGIAKNLERYGIKVFMCARDKFVDDVYIFKSKCVDAELLERLAGEPCDKDKDPSQRNECGCTKSIDIGSYDMKCKHNCIYCYANTQE